MTPEDIAQITAIVAASELRTIAAIEQRTADAIAASELRTTATIADAIAASELRTIAAIEQRTAAAIAASELRTTATIADAIAASELRIAARQDRAVESIAAEFSMLRSEMNSRFQAVDQRLDRIEHLAYTLQFQTVGMNKAIGDGQRLASEFAATQAAQQRAFSELVARVAKIERDIHPEQH